MTSTLTSERDFLHSDKQQRRLKEYFRYFFFFNLNSEFSYENFVNFSENNLCV